MLIVGAGPVGLFAIFQCGMLNLRTHVVDSLPSVGGQCMALYPEKPIFDIPAFPRIDGASLINNLLAQAQPFGPVFHLGQVVQTVTPCSEGGFKIATSTGNKITARSILIAGGAGAYVPNRPPLENIRLYEGQGIHYSVTTKDDFRGQHVIVVGGGDSALDWAITLSEIATTVTLVHRRPGFTAAPATVTKLKELVKANRMTLKAPGHVTAVHGDKNMTHVTISGPSGAEQLSASRLLFFLGSVASLGPIANWGLELEGARICVDPVTQQSSSSGIFAIGDVAVYPNKLKLILCGFSEAAMAAHAIHKFINPNTVLVHRHSTSIGVPTSSLVPSN